tara:strand:- start:412 stop:621 length:210 start_codon:yes stop_codon:yes gene_type:complete
MPLDINLVPSNKAVDALVKKALAALVIAEKEMHDTGDYDHTWLDEATDKITGARRTLELFLYSRAKRRG